MSELQVDDLMAQAITATAGMKLSFHQLCAATAPFYARLAEVEAELENVRGELDSLIQFTRSEIRKLPAEYVRGKQNKLEAAQHDKLPALLGAGE
jgi:hypothetical protein